MAIQETSQLELISSHDPTQRRDRLELVREIVAMANASGGEIDPGVAESGSRPGLSSETLFLLDPANLQDFADDFVKPGHVIVESRQEASDDDDRVELYLRHRKTDLLG